MRKHGIRRALQTRGETPRTLTVAVGDSNLTRPGDCRIDVRDGSREYVDDPFGVWLQESFGDYREVGYSGFSWAGRRDGHIRFLSALDHLLCDMPPVDLVDMRPDARLVGRPPDPAVLPDHVPLLVRFPRDSGRPAARRGWPTWVLMSPEFQDAVAGWAVPWVCKGPFL